MNMIDFKKARLNSFNSLPVPSWKRIKLEGFEFPRVEEYRQDYIKSKAAGLEVRRITEGSPEGFEGFLELKEGFGLGEKFTSQAEALSNSGLLVRVPRNISLEEPLGIAYRLDGENPTVVDHNIIVAEENSRVTLIFDYSSGEGSGKRLFHNGVTKVFAGRGSVVNIVKVQRMNSEALHFDSNIAFLEGEARVNWVSVEIGGAISATSFINNLEGTASEADLRSVYLGDGEGRIDLGYTMNHIGMRTVSNIETRGALKDRAKKVFRGDLHFKKGARRAKGSEEEYVLLLDPTVKSDAIPVLFCAEDDVEGNHAASAGQIDEEKLFYLMSRGFGEREARKLIVEASFRPIIDRIPGEGLRAEIEEEIHRRLVYA